MLDVDQGTLKVSRQTCGQSESDLAIKKRTGKGKHIMLSILRDLLAKKEKQVELTGCDKECYKSVSRKS